MSEDKILNGVNVTTLENVANDIKENPELAKCKFRLKNKWINGGHNHSTVGDFYAANQENSHLNTFELDADEPLILVGTDTGANPVEHLLNALSACLTTSLVYHAALRGIQIDELESELEGDIDLNGFLGLSDSTPKGYTDIRIRFRVDTDAGNLEQLRELASFSPVLNTLTQGTRVNIQLEEK